jgi:hypothetical protein
MLNRRSRRDDPVVAPDGGLAAGDLRDAYQQGRADERARRKRHPLMLTVTVLVALVGVAILVLAAMNGSFERAGQVADYNLGVAQERAEPAVRNAASEAGQAIRDARTAPALPADDPAG